ncbi:hypothetical protein L6452_16958 [Arctium lappa]|uniref:Uncharacterized protein n=1 Tax=Arctium lappa TaxID=4217 RepID=A0ACB9C211_ARCLA|nr:hypothetical protein L6452_16958 [Arctium lappa]
MRIQNYSFYEEYAGGSDDTVHCGNTTICGGFQDSVRNAVSKAVMDAPRNSDYYAQELAVSGTPDESAYVQADCWNTLDENSCTECLESASASILQYLPSSEGRALYTGCFLRYSNTNFLNPEPTQANNGGDINTKLQTSHTGTLVTGTGSGTIYVLAHCYPDLSSIECILCSAEARTSLPSCLPNNGGRVYLEGCFMRFENYSFFDERTGQKDRIMCPNTTRKNNEFEKLASNAVLQAVEAAPRSPNHHAGTQALISGIANRSAYATADCWSSLDAESCGRCLQTAGRSMLGCLPGSRGYALYTGCFMRYSDTNFSNPDNNTRNNTRRSTGVSKRKMVAIESVISSVVAFIVVGSDDAKLLKILNSSSLNFKYYMIKKATSSFDEANKLGQGGFGTVYKGVLPNGREIAAKRLFFNHQHRAGDFYNEVNIISSVEHKNLVKLMQLGERNYINWAKRFDIIVGTAEDLFNKIKTISAPGLPEHCMHIDQVWKHFKEGTVEEVFDPNMMLSDDTVKKEVEKVVHIGLLCTQEVPSLRPTMSMALQMLSKNIQPLPFPSNPAFLPKSNGQPNEFGSDEAFRLGITNPTSVPMVSLTSLGPRWVQFLCDTAHLNSTALPCNMLANFLLPVFQFTNMPMQTSSLCNSHPPIPIHAKSLNQNLPWNPSLVTTFKKSLINSSIFTLTTHHKINKNRRFTVFAVKREEDEQSTPSWAKLDSEEPPPWARNETQQPSSSSNSDLPFFVYLLASAITAIAAIGSVFEYVNQKPVFGVLNSDSIFYTPVLGFFAFTGLPTAAFLWFKSVEVANKEAEEQDRRDGYR